MTDRTVFLVNPASGNGSTGKRWPKLYARAAELGLTGDVLRSSRPGHLTELAREAAADASLLVVVGGDGSLNEVVNGVVGKDSVIGEDIELAILPAGTGQDSGRTYGIPSDFDKAVVIAVSGTTRRVDVGRATFVSPGGDEAQRHFVNMGSVGMSGAVAARANGMSKALGGKATFFYALGRTFVGWKNTDVTVTFDIGQRSGPMHDVIVANGQYAGGGMKLAPDAVPDDGLFDVVLIGDVTKLDFVTTAPKLYSGRHVSHPRVDVVRSATVHVDADKGLPIELEGEPVGTTPVTFEIVPGALRLRVPNRVAENPAPSQAAD